MEPSVMKRKPHSRRKRTSTKSVLRLPDLEHAKTAVLNSLNSLDAQRGYRHAIDEFVDWYCSEPRLAFNRTLVLRYRSHLESRQLAPGTINLRLGAVRCLAYEATECGLLSDVSVVPLREGGAVQVLWQSNRLLKQVLQSQRLTRRVFSSLGSGFSFFRLL